MCTTYPLISLVKSNVPTLAGRSFLLGRFWSWLAVAEEQATDMLYTSGVFSGGRKASQLTCPLDKESLSHAHLKT